MRNLLIHKQITNRDEFSIDKYLVEISKEDLLTPEQEVELARRIKNNDQKALEKLIRGNLRFVVSVAKKYQYGGLSLLDLINEGNLGLIKAAQKFDETKGFKFISYAVWWIRQSIIQALSEQTRIVRLPLNRLSSINKIKKAIPYLEQDFQREPTNTEIAGFLDLSDEEVEIANKIKKRQVSFDKPLALDGDNDFNLYDVVQTDDLPTPDNGLMEDSVKINVKRAMQKLSEREATILKMSFGLYNSPVYSLNDIAMKYDMSSERVRQIKRTGLFKLKSLLKENYAFLEY